MVCITTITELRGRGAILIFHIIRTEVPLNCQEAGGQHPGRRSPEGGWRSEGQGGRGEGGGGSQFGGATLGRSQGEGGIPGVRTKVITAELYYFEKSRTATHFECDIVDMSFTF